MINFSKSKATPVKDVVSDTSRSDVLEFSPVGISPTTIAEDESGVGVGVGCAMPGV